MITKFPFFGGRSGICGMCGFKRPEFESCTVVLHYGTAIVLLVLSVTTWLSEGNISCSLCLDICCNV